MIMKKHLSSCPWGSIPSRDNSNTDTSPIAEFTGQAYSKDADPSTWVQGCDLESSPWWSEILKMQQRSSTHWHSLLWTIWSVACVWRTSESYLCHLHGNTFREIPFNVLQVNLCCAACNVTQLQKKQHSGKSLNMRGLRQYVWLSD